MFRSGRCALLQLDDDVLELRTKEDRHDRRRCLVGAQAMVVAGVRDARSQQVSVDVDATYHREQEREELRVRVRVVAGVEQVLAFVRRDRPVVVFSRAVDAGERLFVDEEHEAVLQGQSTHRAHDDHVVVGADRGRLVDGRHLELAGRHLIVARLRGNPQAPQLAVQIHHEREDPLADGTEVLILQLLALGRRGAKESAPGEHQVGTLGRQAAVDEEVLLLGPDVREHPSGGLVAEPAQDAQRLHAECFL